MHRPPSLAGERSLHARARGRQPCRGIARHLRRDPPDLRTLPRYLRIVAATLARVGRIPREGLRTSRDPWANPGDPSGHPRDLSRNPGEGGANPREVRAHTSRRMAERGRGRRARVPRLGRSLCRRAGESKKRSCGGWLLSTQSGQKAPPDPRSLSRAEVDDRDLLKES